MERYVCNLMQGDSKQLPHQHFQNKVFVELHDDEWTHQKRPGLNFRQSIVQTPKYQGFVLWQ